MLPLKKYWKPIGSAILCFVLYVLQTVYLDFILITHKKLWYISLIPDIIILILFIVLFVIKPHLPFKKIDINSLSFIIWCLYIALIVIKTAYFFRVVVKLAELEDFLQGILQSKNTVIVIAGSSAIFVLFATAVVKYEDLIFLGAIDMIDGTLNLNFLLEESHEMFSYEQESFVLGIACVTLILPVFHLLILGKNSKSAKILTAVYNLVLNIPLFIQRIILFHQGYGALSIFIFKNLILIGKNFLHLIEEIHENINKRREKDSNNECHLEMESLRGQRII